eukprot:7559120-Pyramimonas_sp.AAC.1
MRAFAVDGRSTSKLGGAPSEFSRKEFKSCAVLGSDGLFGHIDIPARRDRRCARKRAALTDASSTEELRCA